MSSMLRIEYYFSVNNLVKDVHLRKNVAQLKSSSQIVSVSVSVFQLGIGFYLSTVPDAMLVFCG